MAAIPLGDPQVDRLNRLIDWLSTQPDALHLCQREEAPADADLPEAVARHFELTGYRALYSLPLADDQGRVGLLLYEAEDPDFLGEPHFEMIKILAGQTTVAIRNALLYREVPLISLLEPLLARRRALMGTSRGRRIAYEAGAARRPGGSGAFWRYGPRPAIFLADHGALRRHSSYRGPRRPAEPGREFRPAAAYARPRVFFKRGESIIR